MKTGQQDLNDEELRRGMALLRTAERKIGSSNMVTITMAATAISCAALGIIKSDTDVLAAGFSSASGVVMGSLARCNYAATRRIEAGIRELKQIVTNNVALRLSIPNREYLASIGVDLDTYDATNAFKEEADDDVHVESQILRVIDAAQRMVHILIQIALG